VAGITECANCGSALVDADPFPVVPKAKEESAGPWPRKRILVGFGLLVVALGLEHVPLPGVDLSNLFRYHSQAGFSLSYYSQMSLGAIGIMPYISASVLVELFHALLHWSRRKGMQPRDRSRLSRIVLGVTIALGALQGWSIAMYLESMRMSSGVSVVVNPGEGFRLMVMATLISTTLLLVWLARLVTRQGLGNGVALLLLFGGISPLWRGWIPNVAQWYQRNLISLGGLALAIAVAVGAVYLLFRFERWHIELAVPRGEGRSSLRWRLKGNPAGIVPRTIAGLVLWLPFSVAALFGLEQIVWEVWNPDGWPFMIISIVFVAAVAWTYVHLTARPERLAEMLKRAGLGFDRALERLQSAHRKRFGIGLAYLLALCVAAMVQRHADFLWVVTQFAGVLTALYVMVIVLDLLDEVTFRRRAPQAVVVLVEHDIHAAKLIEAVLEQGGGIPCLIQAYHARALETFLGPYLDLAIWVPEDRAEQAREILVEINAPLT